jgi:WD40 repeat protein
MAYIEQLVATRQQSLDLFLTNGGQKKEHGCLGSEAAPFIRDAALLTHPLYSTCILSNAKARVQSLEASLAVHYGKNLTVDETDIETPSSYSTRQNKYGVSSIQFDQEGVLFAVGGSSGTVRVYDFDEVYARMQIR